MARYGAKHKATAQELKLLEAAARGKVAAARQLLIQGANVDAKDHREIPWNVTPLMCAAEGGHTEVVRLLLDAGADVNAADKGIADIQPGGNTSLLRAVQHGHRDVVRMLVKAGAKDRPRAGDTALGVAASDGDLKLVRMLLDGGINPNTPDCDRNTPLALAAMKGRSDVAKLLLARGADPNAQSVGGFAPLHWAAENGDIVLARALLDAGAKVDIQESDRFTPLMTAAMSGHEKLMKLLLSRGANAKAVSRGRTLLDYARMSKRKSIICAVERLGVRASEPLETEPVEEEADVSVAEMRGVGSMETNEQIVLVRAPLDRVSKALASHRGATRHTDVYGKSIQFGEPSYLVYRLKGQKWSIIDGFVDERVTLQASDAQALSRQLKTIAIFYRNTDTADYSGYELFDRGRSREKLDCRIRIRFRPDPKRKRRGPSDWHEVEEFLNDFFRTHDTCAPSWSTFLGGWQHKAGDRVRLNFGGEFAESVERLDVVTA
jgi:ankyrin repeat protein